MAFRRSTSPVTSWPRNTCATWWAGRSELARHERLLRFVFPERPGALMRFLSALQPSWNISLFHYRNQGADYGRILVGIQVPGSDRVAFAQFLDTLAYPYIEETAQSGLQAVPALRRRRPSSACRRHTYTSSPCQPIAR